MTRALPLYAMVPEVLFDKTALTEGTLPNSEIMQHINRAFMG